MVKLIQLTEPQQGYAVFMELGGLANDKIREATRTQADGICYKSIPRWARDSETRSTRSLLAWSRHHRSHAQCHMGPDLETLSFSYLKDYFALRWNHGETIDNYLLRAEMTYQRCRNRCGLTISEVGQAYLLIKQLHIRSEDLVQLLRDAYGRLPTTQAELETMKRTLMQFLKITKPQ